MDDTKSVLQACDNCRFVLVHDNCERPYYCRRFPPQVRVGEVDDIPTTELDSWCGEWAPSHDAVHFDTEDGEGCGVVFRRPDEPEWAGRLIGRDSG